MSSDEPKDGDITPGGSRIIEGNVRNEGWTAPESYAENCELIEEHLKPVLGEAENVFHEIISDLIHLDVLIFPPDQRRDFWLYVTSGMGDIRMTTPPDIDATEWSRAELMLGLPREWGDRLDEQETLTEDPDNLYWPIGLLKWLARYPHMAETWFAPGHTIPNIDGEPYAENTGFNGVYLDFSTLLPEDRATVVLPGGDRLNFLGVTLLYPEEMEFKLARGTDALTDKLNRAGVSEVIDLSRDSVLKKASILDFFRRS